jgi:hypothetical protein
VQQAALAIWWDDRAQKVRLNVLREIATDTDSFDEERIIEGSLRVEEQPTKRISQIWTFYGQRDPTKRNSGEDNYRAALADVDLGRETEYGSAAVSKIKARWVETVTAATRLNALQLSRFRDPPRAFAFDLITGESITPAAGYQIGWWGSQDSQGNRIQVPIQVTQVSIFSDRVHVEAEEMLASGEIVLTHTVLLTDYGAIRSWTVPDTWNDANNSIACIGAGAGGRYADNNGGESGGGAGAHASESNVNLTPGASVSYRVGSAGLGGVRGSFQATSGTDTFFGATTFAASTVGAKAGTAGTSRTSPGVGGQASDCIGSVKYSGGDGGTGAPRSEAVGDAGGGGGGGAAGPHGNGADGGSGTSTTQNGGAGGGGADGGYPGEISVGAVGGDGGDNRFSFGGGNSSTPTGDEGGGGRGSDHRLEVAGGPGGDGEQIWTQTITPIFSGGPGGGGGGGGTVSPGYHGGSYGGGGGGSGNLANGGDGAPGLIVISWQEA